MLGIPLPDPTKVAGATDVVVPPQTNDTLLEAQQAQKFAWSPQQTKQVQDTLKTRNVEDSQRAYRLTVNQKAQATKQEAERYQAMIQQENARIQEENAKIQQIQSEITSIQASATAIRSQIDKAAQEQAPVVAQLNQVSSMSQDITGMLQQQMKAEAALSNTIIRNDLQRQGLPVPTRLQ